MPPHQEEEEEEVQDGGGQHETTTDLLVGEESPEQRQGQEEVVAVLKDELHSYDNERAADKDHHAMDDDDNRKDASSSSSSLTRFVRLVRERTDATDIPRTALTLAPYTTMTKLDLSRCGLSSLPDEGFAEAFPHLSVLFLSHNRFTELPAVVGTCRRLQMMAFRSNGMTSVHPEALRGQLRWLILTDNRLTSLPETIGRCGRLQKCMLSGNRLTALPASMEHCTSLELIRLASNRLSEPPWPLLKKLPNLAWMGLSDNPFLRDVITDMPVLEDAAVLDEENDDDDVILGRGAGGVTRRVWYDAVRRHVAVKRFHRHHSHNDENNHGTTTVTTMTSDGHPAAERLMARRLAALQRRRRVALPALVQTYGQTPAGSLVMEYLEDVTALADPPDLRTCSRDVYGSGNGDGNERRWTTTAAERVVTALLETLVALHQAGITHGDLYGHNLLVRNNNDKDKDDNDRDRDDDTPPLVKLSDFGAAYAYDRTADYAPYVEMVELRAFGILVGEINRHVVRQTSILLDQLVRASATVQTFDHLLVAWRKLQLRAMAKAFDPDVDQEVDDDEAKEEKEGW